MEFRLLTAEEIDCRVSTVNKWGVGLLLYKDARCDMNILDETVGAENWQREHYECKGTLFCRVGIKVEPKAELTETQIRLHDNVWVWKSDCGVESNTEAQKGEASDSFKRAVVNWGICRCLYSAPFIWIKAEDANIVQGGSGKFQCYDKFAVEQIIYDDNKNIVALSIKNTSQNKRVFLMDNRKKES